MTSFHPQAKSKANVTNDLTRTVSRLISTEFVPCIKSKGSRFVSGVKVALVKGLLFSIYKTILSLFLPNQSKITSNNRSL